MTRCQSSSSASLLVLALLIVAPQLACAASSLPAIDSPPYARHDTQVQQVAQPAASRVEHGATRTHRRDDIREQSSPPSADVSAAWALASVLMGSMDHPRKEVEVRDEGGRATGSQGAGGEVEYTEDRMTEEESVEALREEVNMAARELVDYRERRDESKQQEEEEEEEERDQHSTVKHEGSEAQGKKEQGRKEEGEEEEEEEERVFEKQVDDAREAPSKASADTDGSKLQRETRGYFQNIDLGLQDNEILPPLKGYKAYNQQLAEATKKLKWQEEKSKGPAAAYERNFMDDFEVPEQAADLEEEESVAVARADEEARARAEQEEMRRQQAEAEAAREEEQRLADIASDMLMQYMDRKQQTSYMKQRQKASVLGNAAEDKRSNEVESDDADGGDLELETIDRLIEISSKLHLPADDVVEIISNVEEKKRRKDAPPVSIPRFRPLVAPPRPQSPVYKYPPAPKIAKPVKSVNPYKKWYKEKGKSKAFKQDYWFKPAKQFMAYPSYPYYQKPYRAYYPVYFPPPKPRLYSKPAFAYDYNFEDSLDYGMKPPKRRNMNKLKGKGQSWKLMALGPPAPYIPNYILPHPRTYYSLPVPKPPQPPANRRPSPSHFYPPDYDNDGVGEQQESDEELENFIEKMYFHRRIF